MTIRGRSLQPRERYASEIVLLTCAVVLAGMATMLAAAEEGERTGVLVVVAVKDFDFQEFRLATDILVREGFAVTVAASETSEAVASNDSTLKPAMLLRNVDPAAFSGLILIGGPGSALFWGDSLFRSLLIDFVALSAEAKQHREQAAGIRVIGAIGLAPLALARAGVLKGRSAAVYQDTRAAQLLKEAGAWFSFRDVVEDGPFVTARGAEAGAKFMQRIVRRLRLKGPEHKGGAR